MRIKAVCKKHPDQVVYLLQATTSYLNEGGVHTSEALENAVEVTLDEANLFCTYAPTTAELEGDVSKIHDVRFEVVDDGDRTKCSEGHPTYKVVDGKAYCAEMICKNYAGSKIGE